MRRKLIYILLLSTLVVNGFCQKDFFVDARLHSGFLYPHHESISYQVEEYITGYEINLSQFASGKHYWDELFYYPHYGMGYYYSNMGNNEVFGKIHALFGYMDIPFIAPTEKFSWNYQLGLGLSYITKKFDIEDNYFNQAIGSHLNVFVRIGTNISYQVSPKIYLGLMLSGFHASSGKITAPNLGLNVLTTSINLNYHFNSDLYVRKTCEPVTLSKKWHYSLLYAGGIKKPTNFTLNHYYISSLSISAERNLSLKRRAGIGLDVFYDPSVKEILEENDDPWKDAYAANYGVHLSHDIIYNRLAWTVQAGVYLYKSPDKITPTYFRTGLKYHITKNIFTSFTIKSHYFVADYIEWGIGYSF